MPVRKPVKKPVRKSATKKKVVKKPVRNPVRKSATKKKVVKKPVRKSATKKKVVKKPIRKSATKKKQMKKSVRKYQRGGSETAGGTARTRVGPARNLTLEQRAYQEIDDELFNKAIHVLSGGLPEGVGPKNKMGLTSREDTVLTLVTLVVTSMFPSASYLTLNTLIGLYTSYYALPHGVVTTGKLILDTEKIKSLLEESSIGQTLKEMEESYIELKNKIMGLRVTTSVTVKQFKEATKNSMDKFNATIVGILNTAKQRAKDVVTAIKGQATQGDRPDTTMIPYDIAQSIPLRNLAALRVVIETHMKGIQDKNLIREVERVIIRDFNNMNITSLILLDEEQEKEKVKTLAERAGSVLGPVAAVGGWVLRLGSKLVEHVGSFARKTYSAAKSRVTTAMTARKKMLSETFAPEYSVEGYPENPGELMKNHAWDMLLEKYKTMKPRVLVLGELGRRSNTKSTRSTRKVILTHGVKPGTQSYFSTFVNNPSDSRYKSEQVQRRIKLLQQKKRGTLKGKKEKNEKKQLLESFRSDKAKRRAGLSPRK